MAPMLSLKDFSSVSTEAVFPLTADKQQVLKTFNGSAALYQVTKALGIKQGDTVLLPAYCCGAELGPFLHQDCRCEFFDVDENLNADIEKIKHQLHISSNIKAVMITHYFGFPQKNMAQLFELCEKHGVALIEDSAHALFSNDGQQALGSTGHFAIFSPRKSLPLTEGGLTVINDASSHNGSKQLQMPAAVPRWQRLVYSMLQNLRSQDKQQAVWHRSLSVFFIAILSIPAIGIKVAKQVPMIKKSIWLTADVEGEDAAPIYEIGMSTSSESVMCKANTRDIIEARRRNYQLWLDEVNRIHACLEDTHSILLNPLLPRLPEGCCPLYFPVVVQNPADVVKNLAQHDIESFNWWQHMHEAVDWSQFPIAASLKSSVVALPVHQKLNSSQIRRMAGCLEQNLEPIN